MKTSVLALVFLVSVSGGCQSPKKTSPKKPDCYEGVSMTNGYNYFICKNGKWVEDTEFESFFRAQEAYRSCLVHALVSRVLSADEMQEVLDQGSSILIPMNASYREDEVDRRFLFALGVQREIRSMSNLPPSKAACVNPWKVKK